MIQAISEMFYQVGFKNLTMDDIANSLAISKKTLYEHFGSKEKLISEVLHHNFKDIQDYFSNIQQRELNAIEELLILKNYVDRKFYAIQRQNSLYQLQRYYGKLYRKIFVTQIHEIRDRLTHNFIKGQKEGLYREDIEPVFSALLLIEIQNTLKSNPDFNQNIEQQLALMDLHSDIFMRGILSPEGLTQYEKLRQTS
ncbi:TetR family transcriptional regulator [Flavobacteriaceae bacterium Ap0902]|nr:TetR family transcriptional regulator [Flavobacteriaceae bacterium Ap0902]